ncbi:MAG: hypothetical protein ABIJ16_00680 [Bacteroidota bacterium]
MINSISQAQFLRLAKYNDPGKIRLLDTTDYLEIKMRDYESDDNSRFMTEFNDGNFNRMEGEFLIMKADYVEKQEQVFESYRYAMTQHSYGADTFEVVALLPENISSITRIGKGAGFFNSVGAIFIYTAIAAPLLSLDFKTLKINSENYFIVAGGSLGLASISFSVSRIFCQKRFYLHPNDRLKEKKLWKIVKE